MENPENVRNQDFLKFRILCSVFVRCLQRNPKLTREMIATDEELTNQIHILTKTVSLEESSAQRNEVF